MDAAIDEKIAHNAEADYQVGAENKEAMVEDEVEAREGCVEKQTGGDEEQPAMEFGLPAPGDRENEKRAKRRHIEYWNNEERLLTGSAELEGIEAGHHDRGRDTERNHRRPKHRSEPPEESMPLYAPRPHQSRLKEEKQHPTGKRRSMDPKNPRARNSGVKEIFVDGAAETREDYHREQQRHREIEALIGELPRPGEGFHRARRGGLRKRSHHLLPIQGEGRGVAGTLSREDSNPQWAKSKEVGDWVQRGSVNPHSFHNFSQTHIPDRAFIDNGNPS